MKALKAFIKPFEASQRSVKIKSVRPGLGREGLSLKVIEKFVLLKMTV